jgi:CP family cyanate transporter-like MFS transporter
VTARVVAATRARARSPLLLAAAILLITLNLRLVITAVPPVLDDIRAALHLSGVGAGLLTTAPVLCFGITAPIAPVLGRRLGEETALMGCLIALTGGIALRAIPAVPPLFAGTILLGVAIAIANVLIPSVVKRDFPRPGTMMGLYSVGLGASGALGAGLTVPLEDALGSWRWALAAWGAVAVLAALTWIPALSASRATPAEPPSRVTLWRDRTAWMITGFFGFQSLLFYSVASWAPDILRDAGMSSGTAGFMVSVVLIVGLPVSLLTPALAARREDQRPLAAGMAALWIAGLLGLLLSPGTGTLVWMAFIGAGQGAGLALALTLMVVRSPPGGTAAAMSGMAQTVGYLLAACGPVTLGAVHDATGSWHPPVLLLLAATVALLGCGLGASRPRMLGGGEPES